MIERAKKSSTDKKITISNINIEETIMNFNFERSTKSAIYDYEEQTSRAYKQIINADIQIYFEYGLLYIHSKNLTESQIIKTFLDKSFQSLILEQNKKKKVLNEPKFNEGISDLWLKNNTIDNKINIDKLSLHMLYLFFLFNSEISKFSSICMKGIYLKEELISKKSDEAKIKVVPMSRTFKKKS